MDYAQGTKIETRMPWGLIVGAIALCPDGKVRHCKRVAQSADTFFSIPASVTYRGKTVAGYITVETMEGFTTATDTDPAVVKFVPYRYRKNGALFPERKKA
jgi:hypothetical protein